MLTKKQLKERLYTILSLDSHPGHISAGFAVGVFISFTPFFGLHTWIAIAAAFLFRLNKVTCVTGAWVNNPLTMFPMLGVSFKLGRFLRGRPPIELHLRGLEWRYLEKYASSVLLGTAIVGFCAALIAYFACYYLVVQFRARDEMQNHLLREMEQVGEDLE